MPKTKKILLVEDEEFLRSITAKRLEKEGYQIVVAGDGQAALDMAASEQPDLILLDLLLPVINGFDVLAKLKADPNVKHIPVIVFSNLGQREDVVKAKNSGAQDYLVKANFTLDDVAAKVADVLSKT